MVCGAESETTGLGKGRRSRSQLFGDLLLTRSALAESRPTVMESEVLLVFWSGPFELMSWKCICKLKRLLVKLKQKIQRTPHVLIRVQEKDNS